MKNKIILGKLIFVLLFVTSLFTILVNKGFYFASFQDKVVVEVLDNNDVFNKIKKIDGVSLVDKTNSRIEFQHKNIDEVGSSIAEKIDSEEDIKSVTFYEVESDVQSLYINFLLIFIILIGAYFFCSFYVLYRNDKRTSSKDIIILFLRAIGFILVSTIIQLGIISIISRIYQVKLIELYSILLGTFIFLSSYAVALLKLKSVVIENDSEVKKIIKAELFKSGLVAVKVLGIVLLCISFGLGVHFILPGMVLFVAVVNFSFTPSILANFNIKSTAKKLYTRFLKKEKKVVKSSEKTESNKKNTKSLSKNRGFITKKKKKHYKS